MGTTTKRFEQYVSLIAQQLGHADRVEPFRGYCTGLLLPVQRKSVEPMAAHLAPTRVRSEHQRLHHFVADAPWSDDAVLSAVRDYVLEQVAPRAGQPEALLIDDTGFAKKGTHSVGVARQYCGQLGKQDNCQVAVSVSLATEQGSVPIGFRLYLPEKGAKGYRRRKKAGVPQEVKFLTKPEIALEEIRGAKAAGDAVGIVLADAAYGNDTSWREELSEIELEYCVGVQSSTTVWSKGTG